ncbi:hypothetical protein IMF23_04405, partial [Chelatococcus daeguensis]|nr:hypothetical protein [Chelatococcus daeguensis]
RARVIHELKCGGRRADLAAVEREQIWLFEIKSERDTLDRLGDQVKAFSSASHYTIVVAHERWFDREPYANGTPRLSWPHRTAGPHGTWCYPDPSADISPYGLYRWRLPARTMRQPHALRLLELLWRAELQWECERHGIPFRSRDTAPMLMERMAWRMTGEQIARAVCRQLRARWFPEADPPVVPVVPKQIETSHTAVE